MIDLPTPFTPAPFPLPREHALLKRWDVSREKEGAAKGGKGGKLAKSVTGPRPASSPALKAAKGSTQKKGPRA